MMKPLHRLPALLFALAFVVPMAAQTPAGNGAEREEYWAVTGDDIIERARRVLQMKPDNAPIWHSGMVNANHWLVQFELAFLEAAGPEVVRNRAAGLRRLNELRDQARQRGILTDGAGKTLEVLISLVEANAELAADRDRLAGELDEERQEHLETLDKLAALRDIEQQLDQRPEDDGEEP